MAAIVGSLFARWWRSARQTMTGHAIMGLAADTGLFIDGCLDAGWTDPVMTPLYADRCLDFIERHNTAQRLNFPAALEHLFVELRRIVSLELAKVRALDA